MCMRSGGFGAHLFLHCEMVRFLCGGLFGILGEAWIEVDSLLIANPDCGFWSDKERKILWRYATLAILWVIWLERNDRV